MAILVCWFKFGKQYLPENAKKYFIPYTVLALVVCAGMQFAFYLHCETATEASIYSAFAQNVAMSVLFLTALFQRGDCQPGSEGETGVFDADYICNRRNRGNTQFSMFCQRYPDSHKE